MYCHHEAPPSQSEGCAVTLEHGLGADTVNRHISIQQLGFYGVDVASVRPSNGHAQPNTLSRGKENAISIYHIAKISTFEIDMLVRWAKDGKVWCQLEWTFLDSEFPVFTTRHALVEEETCGVGFVGGLGWAIRSLSRFLTPSKEPPAVPEELDSPTGDSPDRHESPPQASCPGSIGDLAEPSWYDASCQLPCSPPYTLRSESPFPFDLQEYTRDDSTPTFTPQYPRPLPHPDSDSRDSDFFSSANQAWTPAETLSDPEGHADMGTDIHGMGSPERMTDGMTSVGATGLPIPCCQGPEPKDEYVSNNEARTFDDVQKQIHLEIFRQRQLEAEALYVRTGDPSLLLAVCRDAATNEWAWRQSGLSLF